MNTMKMESLKKMRVLKLLVVAFVFFTATLSYAQGTASGKASSSGATFVENPLQGTGMGSNMRLPLFLGGSVGFGSGAGVGDGNDVGLCQIRPTIGAWIPGIAFLRLGYGFSSLEETDEDGNTSKVKTSNFSVESGAHLMSEFFITGAYTRASALSEKGDISWNEWSVGIGTFWPVFSRTFLTLDVGYHWVLEHYDPFLDKRVSGGRIQMNLGFIVFVY